MMRIIDCGGDLADVSAKKEALLAVMHFAFTEQSCCRCVVHVTPNRCIIYYVCLYSFLTTSSYCCTWFVLGF